MFLAPLATRSRPRLPEFFALSALLAAATVGSACVGTEGRLRKLAPEEDEELSAADLDRRDDTIELIEDGEFEAARRELDHLLVNQHLFRARRLLEKGSPADALVHVDKLLALEPRHLEGRLLKADGSLMLAEEGIANGASASLIEGSLQDALDFYTRVRDSEPRAVFGASRAARMLGDTAAAVRWAREGRRLLADNTVADDATDPVPHRTVAEALYRAYAEARSAYNAEVAAAEAAAAASEEASAAEGSVEDATTTEVTPPAQPAELRSLYTETETALGDLVGRASDDVWVWTTFCDLYEWEGRDDLARKKAEQGLGFHPNDAGLLDRLARVARGEGGRANSIDRLAAFTSSHPNNALGHWYEALERFEHGVDRMVKDGEREYDRDAFTAAEASFRRARELEPSFEWSCKAYEVMCRDARGWCAYFTDDLELAVDEFLSMNDVMERGVEWELEGRLRSGVMGIAFVGDQYNNRRNNLRAAECFELAFQLEPSNATWANNAGFFLRDAAVNDIEPEGRRLCRAARGKIQDPKTLEALRELAGIAPDVAHGSAEERAALVAASNERMAQARDLMDRSWIAYEVAAELSPDDVRIVNDAGLVLVYYVHEHLDVAKALLEKAAAMGAEQVAAMRARLETEELTDEERADLDTELYDLENAWGDAHENLGVFAWLHEQDAATAIPHFELAVEIGPAERPIIINNYLPLLRGERELGDVGEVETFTEYARWAHDCE